MALVTPIAECNDTSINDISWDQEYLIFIYHFRRSQKPPITQFIYTNSGFIAQSMSYATKIISFRYSLIIVKAVGSCTKLYIKMWVSPVTMATKG